MRRVYTVEMDNGEVYGVPAEVIASHYAKYYEKEHGEDFKENFDSMIAWFDSNDYEFADWAKNNMDWSDVEDKSFLVETKKEKTDFQEGWCNGDFSMVLLDDKAAQKYGPYYEGSLEESINKKRD